MPQMREMEIEMTRYIGYWGSWCSFKPSNMAASVTPQGAIIEENITPAIGDVFILPSDTRGLSSLQKYQKLLPQGMVFGPATGWDENYFRVV